MPRCPTGSTEFKSGVARALDYVAATGVKRVHMMAGNAARSDPKAEASYRRAIEYAAPIFAERGVDLLLEPINARNMPGYFLNDFAYTRDLIASLGLPNVKLQFDVYHRQIMHGDVTMAFRALQPIVGHIQVASVPSRHEPDGEELNFPFLFAEFDRLGYDGYIGCEYNPRAGTVEGLGWFQPYRRSLTCRCFSAPSPTTIRAPPISRTRSIATASRPFKPSACPAAGFEADDAEAIVVALKIRSVEARRAVEAATAAYDWLASRGARHVMYKVCSTFNSTDAGNIGPVGEALGAQRAGGCILVTPGLSGDRTHRLSRASVRRLGSLEREPAQGPSAQSDARFQSRAGACSGSRKAPSVSSTC